MDSWWTQIGVRGQDINFPYKNRAQLERELDDLAQAGLPELPFGYDAKTTDRLTAEEIEALLFGHTISGRDIKTGETFTDVIAADGALSETADWGPDTGTVAYLGKNLICYTYEEWGGTCGAIFRNPGGKPRAAGRVRLGVRMLRALFLSDQITDRRPRAMRRPFGTLDARSPRYSVCSVGPNGGRAPGTRPLEVKSRALLTEVATPSICWRVRRARLPD